VKHPGKAIVFLLSVLLALCANSRVESRDKGSSTPRILISFDGAQPQVIEKLLKSGKLPANGGFAKLISKGTQGARRDGSPSHRDGDEPRHARHRRLSGTDEHSGEHASSNGDIFDHDAQRLWRRDRCRDAVGGR